MSIKNVTETEIIGWHRSQGGNEARAAGHALRILRECVELCIASGASEEEIKMAVRRECDKGVARSEFGIDHSPTEMIEEYVDVWLLMLVYRGYFIHPGDFVDASQAKMQILRSRLWEADADGVLWRPGTRPGSGSPIKPKSS